jgi:predicted choloylglycine hydrolase
MIHRVNFDAIREGAPGNGWRETLERFWPAYRSWFLRHGGDAGETATRRARARLRGAMPELFPTYERLVQLAGGDPIAERFLTLYDPPPFLSGCSQTVWRIGERRALIRNYDFAPDLAECRIVHTRWRSKRVMGASECLWGLNDGMNDSGLAVSLTYGGSRAVGPGFGIPLILRYILEVCEDVGQALDVLRRVPSHMAYNVTLLDATGEFRTVHLHPHRPLVVSRDPCATNHQGHVEDARYAAWSLTRERFRFLRNATRTPCETLEEALGLFHRHPLHQDRYHEHFGTLYTVAYDPVERAATFAWPGQEPWVLSIDGFRADGRIVQYREDRGGAFQHREDRNGTATRAPAVVPVAEPSWSGEARCGLAVMEYQAELARRYVGGNTDGVIREIRLEIEKTGRVPWEHMSRLWAA